ncbi:cell wall hydrolase [Varunaivibrio sulfuroxidans]|uniref:Cell wall hydrolase n=1 Tax=Varunaivibrio sulfuroxidans TaxID=1773489 RepID=A0A4R3J887_9PROT|nr:cell wall hydrolase [Varunaivibrio sulfuroxidans]TCS61682.1 cell wall hydrolase [Varunaivibrio sulfuroxidans]WES32135.1 cell wall hydrolase [Varunaivibrio sulfuroxidans]
MTAPIPATAKENGARPTTNAMPPEDRRHTVDILARTLYGEARGESLAGKEAIAAVVINRVARAKTRGGYWWGDTIAEVCQKPWQFSCWNESDPNRRKILAVRSGNRIFDSCLRIARRAEAGLLRDETKGATHYHACNINPPWARGKAASVEIGRHLFYNDIE